MKVFENTRNGAIGHLITETEETVELKMVEDETIVSLSPNTLKRWWKQIDEIADPVTKKEVKVKPKEEVKEEKPKKIPSKKAFDQAELVLSGEPKPIENAAKLYMDSLIAEHDCEAVVGKLKTFISVKFNGRMIFFYTYSKKGITMSVVKGLVPEGLQFIEHKHLFAAKLTFGNPLSEKRADVMKDLFEKSLAYSIAKRAKK